MTYAQSAADVGVPDRVRVTGNPVRASVLAATREEGRTLLGVPEDALMLLVFGGSLGARQINEGVAACKEDLLAVPGLHVVHITGPRELENAQQALALAPEEQKRWHVMGYQDRMGETLAAADAVVPVPDSAAAYRSRMKTAGLSSGEEIRICLLYTSVP